MTKITTDDHLIFAEKMYVDYWNNFITVVRFAEYYEIDPGIANHLIDLGRAVHNNEMKKGLYE